MAVCLVTAYSHVRSHERQIAITASGADPGGEFCSDFRLTPEQAAQFFSQARTVSAEFIHANAQLLPCWLRGTMVLEGRTWQWEVRAGGTARLEATDGEVRLLFCDRCDALLGGAPP